MELKIEQKNEDPLLERTRIEGTLSFDSATPSNAEVTKQIAGALKIEENAVAIRHIYTAFGKKSAKVIAYAYKDEASKQDVEPKSKKKKDAEDKAEAPKQEAPAKEETKEESKEEKPKEVKENEPKEAEEKPKKQ